VKGEGRIVKENSFWNNVDIVDTSFGRYVDVGI
jgi:hypothetical protein